MNGRDVKGRYDIGHKLWEGNKYFGRNHIVSEEERVKMSLAKKGKVGNRKGSHPSEETRKKMSDGKRISIALNPDIRYVIGDSRIVLKGYEESSIHLVVTSPPYWNAKDYEKCGQIGFGQTYSEYVTELDKIWRECERVLVPNGKICVNLQPLPVSKQTDDDRSSILDVMADVEVTMKKLNLALSNIFIWDKRKYNNQRIFGSYPYPPNLYSHVAFEYIYVFRKPGQSRVIPQERKDRSKISQDEWSKWCFNSIWDIPPVIKFGPKGEIQSHIAPFPLEIPRRLIRLFSFVGDTVLDPFLGCGTTLGACLLEERNGIGIELQSSYEPLIKLMLKDPKHIPRYELAASLEHNRTLMEFVEANE